MSTINRLYNLLHSGNPGDIPYYTRHCPVGLRVLELGSGNGRVAAALHRNGCIVEGLDNDPLMITAFENAMTGLDPRPSCCQGDMRKGIPGKKFHRIIIPFNGLLCMLSLDDVQQVLTAAAGQLEPDGELIFDVYYVPDDFENDGVEDDFYIDTAVLDDNGASVTVYEKTLANEDPQRFDTSYIFVFNQGTSEEKQLEQTILQRCLYMDQIQRCLGNAGFKDVRIHCDFDERSTEQDISDDTRQLIVHARLHGPLTS